jgi:hypothetical protein
MVSAHFSRTPRDFSHTPLEIFDIVREIAAPFTFPDWEAEKNIFWYTRSKIAILGIHLNP